MYPYKIQFVQKLLPQDHQQRLQYAIRFASLATQTDFLNTVFMSDEVHLYLNGFVNKQNCRFWSFENSMVIHQNQLHPSKCTVWWGVRIIGSYFFENENESP